MNDPRVIALTGSKNAGKTKLIEVYTPRLREKTGWKIGTIKCAFKHVRFDEGEYSYDVARHLKAGVVQSSFSSSVHTVVIKEGQQLLRDIIGMMGELDFIFIEGQPDDVRGYPQVALIRDGVEIAEYVNEFTVAVSSINRDLDINHPLHIPFESLMDILVGKTFPLLSGLDCGHCGNSSCEEMMVSLIRGTNLIGDCEPRRLERSGFKLLVNGTQVPCVGFVKDIITKTFSGMVSALKGVDGDIKEVKLEFRNENTMDGERGSEK
ncbi:MAG: molybdopterin-guanine dinucleotide biosynthesis protein MobB [Candidatus Odinarchaeota archaeon]